MVAIVHASGELFMKRIHLIMSRHLGLDIHLLMDEWKRLSVCTQALCVSQPKPIGICAYSILHISHVVRTIYRNLPTYSYKPICVGRSTWHMGLCSTVGFMAIWPIYGVMHRCSDHCISCHHRPRLPHLDPQLCRRQHRHKNLVIPTSTHWSTSNNINRRRRDSVGLVLVCAFEYDDDSRVISHSINWTFFFFVRRIYEQIVSIY